MASLTSDAAVMEERVGRRGESHQRRCSHGGESGTTWRWRWRREDGIYAGSQETGRVVEDLTHVESLAAVAGSETVALRCRRVGGPGQH